MERWSRGIALALAANQIVGRHRWQSGLTSPAARWELRFTGLAAWN